MQSSENPSTLSQSVLYAEDAQVITAHKTSTATKEEISKYIKEVFGLAYPEAIAIFTCESGLNPYAYNPETKAKERGITRYSSCGVAQLNSSECKPDGSILFDYKTNIERAYEMYQARQWKPWYNCSKKLGL